MEANEGGAGCRKIRDDAIDRAHHEVHVDRCLDPVTAQRLAHQRTDGEIRHVMVVHHVEVNQVCTRLEHRIDLIPEAREISRQNRRSYPGLGHDHSLTDRAGQP